MTHALCWPRECRLNYRLTEACEEDIDALCAQECSLGAQACGGRVLRCLTDKQDSIKTKVGLFRGLARGSCMPAELHQEAASGPMALQAGASWPARWQAKG